MLARAIALAGCLVVACSDEPRPGAEGGPARPPVMRSIERGPCVAGTENREPERELPLVQQDPFSSSAETALRYNVGYPHRQAELLVFPRSDEPRDAERAEWSSLWESVGAEVVRFDAALPMYQIRFPPEAALEDAADRLLREGRERIASIEANSCVFPQQQQLGVSDPNAPEQWGHWKIGLAEAWAVETGKKSVVVAVMDSGINHLHPDLLCNFWDNPCDLPNGKDDACPGHPADRRVDDVHGWNFWDGNDQLIDVAHHGTLIAGIVGACPNSIGIVGINWSVSLMDLKVYETVAGTGALDAVLSAIPYAVGYGAHVINASWTTAASPKLAEAISKAAGVIVATAAGDAPVDGKELVTPDTAFPCNWTLPNLSPTPVPNLICVTSSTRTDAKTATANYGAAVQIAAPGVEILSTQGNDIGEKWGTSFAAPYVAGVTALVRAHFPSLPTDQIVSRVLSGDDLPTLSGVTRPKGAPGTGSRLNACTALGCRTAPPGEPVLLP